MYKFLNSLMGNVLSRRISMLAVVVVLAMSASAQKTFTHYEGKSGRPLVNGMQQVHEDWHVIYATSGSSVPLSRRTDAFESYARWYNYATDNADANITIQNANTGAISTTRGTVYYSGSNNVGATATYAFNGTAVKIACDQSGYTDGQNNTNSFREPTLSQRIVYDIRPASEMADAMTATSATKWGEVHKMIAPTGRTLHIGPDYAFWGDDSNYFRYNSSDQLRQMNGSAWQTNANNSGWHWSVNGGAATEDPGAPASSQFVSVSSNTAGLVTYELTYKTSSRTYYVAKFEVTYESDRAVGPYTNLSATYANKVANLDPVAEEKFNFVGTSTTTISGTTYYTKPFNVDESTFSFFYGGENRRHGGPYYTEYALLNNTNNIYGCTNTGVGTLSNHGGGAGYMVYVDGSDIVGQVFSLNIKDLLLCPGAVMYFSAWIGDVSTNNAGKPDLDFIVTGIKANGDEEVVTTFTTGEFSHSNTATGITSRGQNKWLRILFPIEFKTQSEFKEFRLKVTNKCANNSGNDFVIDDIAVYFQPAPLTPIEATSPATCLDDNTPLVLYTKIDYARIDGFAGRDYYYRWLDENMQPIDAPYLNKVTDTKGKSAGKITLPNSYTNVGSAPTKASFEAFNSAYYNLPADASAQYAYIYDASAVHFDGIADARYSAFIATPIPLPATGRCSEYTCVVSLDLETLGSSDDCSSSQTIPLTSGMGVHSEAAGATVKGLEQKACANFSYDLTFLVKYVVLEGKDGTTTKDSRYKAHWLFGVEPDPTKPAEVAEFQALYGASFAAIKAALEHLNVDAKKDAVSTMTPLESDVYEALKTANGGTYPVYSGSADEKLVNRLVQKGLLILASDLEDPFKYVVMPLSEQTRLSVTAFPVEKEKTDAPDCLTPQSITLTFKNLGPDDEPDGDQDVMTFVKSYTEVVPAFVASRPRRVRVPMYNSARERVSTKDVKVKLTNPGKMYDLGSMYLYSTDDTEATVSSATPTTLVSAAHTGPITGQDAVTFNGLNNLKEGHTYTFKVLYTPKTAGATPSESEVNDYCGGVDPNDPTKLRPGEAFITFVIVPDTLTFVPSEQDGSWDDDYSFRFTDTQKKEYNVAPSQYTSVLFAQGNHILLNRTTNQFQEPGNDRMVDKNALPYITWDIDYEPNVANNIYVPANTSIVGQTNIDAKGTYTFDMPVNPNKWTMTAMPLKGIVTGDMYIPAAGEAEKVVYDNGKFVVATMNQDYGKYAADRIANSFYNSMYNSEVYHIEPDGLTNISSSTWSLATNSLNTPLTPGTGWALGYDNTAENMIVRLPKAETEYHYFRNDAWLGMSETIDRAAAGKPALEFNEDGEMEIELKNNVQSNVFLLGNPSFAYLDLTKFTKKNGINTFYLSGLTASTRYDHVTGKVLSDGTWASTEYTAGAIAPLHAVLIKAANKTNSLKVILTPDMFVTKPADFVEASAPRRVAGIAEKKLFISAAAAGFTSSALLMESDAASNDATDDEDAEVFLLDKAKTPFAIYTVASNKALAINQISDAEVVPLAMYAQKDIAAEVVTFSGDDAYVSEWDLVDNKTNTRWELSDGFSVNLQMQNDGTVRYYLEHARHNAPSIETGIDDNDLSFGTYTHDGMLTVFSADDMVDFRLYDAAGRLIAAQKNAGRQQDFSLVKGVYVVRANGNTAKVVVK